MVAQAEPEQLISNGVPQKALEQELRARTKTVSTANFDHLKGNSLERRLLVIRANSIRICVPLSCV